jgi:hypothetical protein
LAAQLDARGRIERRDPGSPRQDLWEDYDVELLYKFYQTFYAAVRPGKASREPLSYWLRSMSPLVKANPEEVDTHLLLALNYSKQTSNNKVRALLLHKRAHVRLCSRTFWAASDSPTTAQLTRGVTDLVVLGTDSIASCRLINFIAVNQSYGVVMARAMLEECAEILVENAIQRGFIAGCK